MGIEVELQNERCNSISETVHDSEVLAQILSDLDDSASICLRFIDPYGNTIFNSIQARILLVEWDTLKQAFSEHNAEEQWAKTRALIIRCSEEMHTYIKFIGD